MIVALAACLFHFLSISSNATHPQTNVPFLFEHPHKQTKKYFIYALSGVFFSIFNSVLDFLIFDCEGAAPVAVPHCFACMFLKNYDFCMRLSQLPSDKQENEVCILQAVRGLIIVSLHPARERLDQSEGSLALHHGLVPSHGGKGWARRSE
ncbi:unnamed protein product [Amoebophrya sp. A120]|nr:unnamed protein product [Amoebophrya sp. A120]|eukprot:GSA120T00004633001.1